MPHGDLSEYIRTFTGNRYWPLDPRPEDVSIIDIAHHLSNLCRFTGATRFFYSVAQHSLYVSWLVPTLTALLHDAPEAYLNDIARPVKHSDLYAPYRELEAKNWLAIAEHFQISAEMGPEIKVADDRVLLAEKRDLMGGVGEKWRLVMDVEPAPWDVVCMLPKVAEQMFLQRFQELGGKL